MASRQDKVWAFVLLWGAVACDQRGELREWRPEDHQPPPAVTPENQGEGGGSEDIRVRAAAALWSTRCATCHGADGRGDGPGRPPGAPMPDFTQPSFHAERTDAQLAQVIANGRGLMPGFGDQFTDAGLAALVEHVRGLRAGE